MFDALVGIPWVDKGRAPSGVDCWGLVVLANRARGLELPSYSDRYVTAADRRAIARLIAGELDDWVEIEAGRETVWDCVLLRDGPLPRHIGLVVAPGRMLHVEEHRTSVIESYRSGTIRHRIVGFFRHRATME